MASTSETGHAKNVSNLENLISFCTGYGTAYNPSKSAIKIPALNTLHITAKNSLAGVITSKTVFINATNARQAAFNPIKKLCTRIINALGATDASDKLVKDAKSINNKIQGRRSSDKPIPISPQAETTEVTEVVEDKTISVSQLSFDNQIENFAKLIDLVTNEPSYEPNETELQVSTLSDTLDNLKTTNTAVITAYTNYSNARIARNTILYKEENGLIDIAGDVKKYIKSVFGATSPQFKQVSGLAFRKVK